ncbi:hypothetical protein G6F47_008215 [Rhizopus delemar]|nr:hypothetical protein G6F54_009318 [Rhizopus delemar]KAG1625071.1 hypothetical protein G6F45_009479 [Rhizopus arrhizus]KAG1506660.1 hypothetical protein G6F53_009527 [Rhizopus delemar]KAG1563164.1 hypothetical protein G6F49_000275 [Rhizopus delemar]KAG1596435.1 hypothetical protein G6F47_008215 [Rhizopus delemar]
MSNLSELLNIRNKSENHDHSDSLNTDHKTFNFASSSDILSRVQAFLPQIQQANEQLQSEDVSKLNIENVNENEEQYIEMNLGLGVYDVKKDGEDDSDSEEEEEEEEEKEKTIKLPSSQPIPDKKPTIELMDDMEIVEK